MTKPELPHNIGPYKILKSLGKGGMGEVFLAFDPKCKREIALKRIRSDLRAQTVIRNRFLREALITSQLAHPAIVPIYSIQEEDDHLYYIMPYLEGCTLKDTLKKAILTQNENPTKSCNHTSIFSFLRIFVTVCQAIAYAHSKGYLHRDIKPENIILGKYGQIHILDWGLVKEIGDISADEEVTIIETSEDLTKPGKLVGTLAYLAPERALKQPSSIASDIYALGVILYQLLTLKLPFKRKNIKEFKETLSKEQFIDPIIVAPYRDVPPELSRIVKKCLEPNPQGRYTTVDALINDLDNYLEGRSEWFKAAALDLNKKSDWQFHENILIPEHIVITKGAATAEWVSVMVSSESFSGNTQLRAKVKIDEQGSGIGFLLSVPETLEREHPTDGYCLWLSAQSNQPSKLYRSTVEVMDLPEIVLPQDRWVEIRLEKIDQNIHFYLDNELKFSYISHIPLSGTHVGLLLRDTHFSLNNLEVFVGSLNLSVSCLKIPDSFLSQKDYHKALSEYRRIANSFPGRMEGREALFRAGITLLEESLSYKEAKKTAETMNLALEEFEKLRKTPGAPLEYLGKALVYEAAHEIIEEVKCYEIAFRRYPKHPLLPILEEQITYRLHYLSRHDRAATYRFVLLILRTIPSLAKTGVTKMLIRHVFLHLEKLYFIEEPPHLLQNEEHLLTHFSIQLGFWLALPALLGEIIDSLSDEDPTELTFKKNALFCQIYLGYTESIADNYPLLHLCNTINTRSLESSLDQLFHLTNAQPIGREAERCFYFIFEKALLLKKPELVIKAGNTLQTSISSIELDCFLIWSYLMQRNVNEAARLFQKYPLDMLNQETTLLHFLYGCFLYITEGKEIAEIHFSGILDTPFPTTWMLASHYLFGKGVDPTTLVEKALFYEKKELYRQLALFYYCADNETRSEYFHNLSLSYDAITKNY